MAKVTGRNAFLRIISSACDYSASAYVNLSGDLNSITLTLNADTPEVTVFGQTNKERLFDGIKDWELGFEGYYQGNGTASIDETLFNLLAGSCMIDYGPTGSTSGCVKHSGCAVLTNYSVNFELESAITVSGTIVARTGSLTLGTF
jgi:hypothetical protein